MFRHASTYARLEHSVGRCSAVVSSRQQSGCSALSRVEKGSDRPNCRKQDARLLNSNPCRMSMTIPILLPDVYFFGVFFCKPIREARNQSAAIECSRSNAHARIESKRSRCVFCGAGPNTAAVAKWPKRQVLFPFGPCYLRPPSANANSNWRLAAT